jgi:hypothetical protein
MGHRPAEGVAQELVIFRQRPEWSSAVSKLRGLAAAGGEGARAAASRYSQVYAGRRGAMVVDVVASRQRNYKTRVLPLVDRWSAVVAEPTLAALSATPLKAKDFGLQASEPIAMRTIAANLLALSTELAVSEDEACRVWADSVQGLEHAHKLDPVVGDVSGIGPALFAYMRMRCGADALKPDQRVVAALSDLGFSVPGDGHSTIVIARAAAAEIGFDLLTLDQLLWGRTG